jgi:transposase
MAEAGLKQGDKKMHVDEMRVGLRGQVRRVWAERGVKIVQPLQFVYEFAYLLLGVDGQTGKLKWTWVEHMRQADLAPALQDWPLNGIIWDNAPAHHGKQVTTLPIQFIFLPPYSPELNPPERIFEELRRVIEGRNYPSLRAKMIAVETELRKLAADPARVKSLANWTWIQTALEDLPT